MYKFLFLLMPILSLFAADTLLLTLEDVVELAKTESPDLISAQHRFRRSYWEYRTHRSHFVPHLSIRGEIPSYNRTISSVTQSDGTELFREHENASSSVNLSLSQNIGFTGGELNLSSELVRNDIFDDPVSTSYLASPFFIGLSQPLFAYNQYRWDRAIEPIKFEEARRRYMEDLEQISIDATNLFFDLLSAQINLQIAEINASVNDTLFKIAQGRFNLGTIAENDLLQMELTLLNSNVDLENAKFELQSKLFSLRSFLGIQSSSEIALIIPSEIAEITLEYDDALQKAKQYNTQAIGFEKRILQAESELKRTRAESNLNINLYASYGLVNTADDIGDVFTDPRDRQHVRLGFSIPIIDGGYSKGRVRMAQSNRELVISSIEREQIDFEQSVFLKIRRFNIQKSQVAIAAKADTVAQKRYDVARQRYMIGKITITDLNNAQTDKDASSKSYIEALRSYWVNYYDIRKLTHFDFVENTEIEFIEYDL